MSEFRLNQMRAYISKKRYEKHKSIYKKEIENITLNITLEDLRPATEDDIYDGNLIISYLVMDIDFGFNVRFIENARFMKRLLKEDPDCCYCVLKDEEE